MLVLDKVNVVLVAVQETEVEKGGGPLVGTGDLYN